MPILRSPSSIPSADRSRWQAISPFTTGTRATTPRTSRVFASGWAGDPMTAVTGGPPPPRAGSDCSDERVAPEQLAKCIEDYLAEHPSAAVLEDGRVIFDMRNARYSVTESHGRCLLQLWSEERNVMRTVVDLQVRAQCVRVVTRRMGAPKPQVFELVTSSDRRTPTARDSTRRNYQRLLERVLAREFLGSKVDGMRAAMDLEHSFGPAYARGRLLKGTAAEAVIGVGAA